MHQVRPRLVCKIAEGEIVQRVGLDLIDESRVRVRRSQDAVVVCLKVVCHGLTLGRQTNFLFQVNGDVTVLPDHSRGEER